ncbi:DUF222 domain-containing protein, partial [Nocardia sp. JMUB6875]|uniref:DUF222 domain-containing protein n=1 Tax=Nocardia sp. JMUB6875 TaxID=3158170 RepID=UPI0034E88F95
MTSGGGVSGSTIADAIAMLAAVTDILLTDSLGGFSDAEFVVQMQEFEAAKRRLAAVDHRFVGEVRQRNLPEKAGWKNHTGKYLQQVLRLGHAEAGARVNAAEQLG